MTWLTSASLVCFKHVVAVLLFRHNLILIIISHPKVENFFSDDLQLYLESAYPAWCDILLVIEDNTFPIGSWHFSMSIAQRLQLRLEEGNKDFKQKLRVFL